MILQSEGIFDGRLGNLSTCGQVGGGGNILISGLVVRGTASKRLLLRAAGPALTAFGLTGTLARPIPSLFDGAGHPLFSNTGWSTAAKQVGAFAFPDGSADCALLVTLPPGSYTAQVSGGGALGLALLESYDLTTMQSRLVNLSSRGVVGTDQNIIIPGIATGGTSARLLLVRAIGPALDAFGVMVRSVAMATRASAPRNWNQGKAETCGEDDMSVSIRPPEVESRQSSVPTHTHRLPVILGPELQNKRCRHLRPHVRLSIARRPVRPARVQDRGIVHAGIQRIAPLHRVQSENSRCDLSQPPKEFPQPV